MKGTRTMLAAMLTLLSAPVSAQVFGADARVEEEVLGAVAGREDTNQTTVSNNVNEVSNNSVGDNSVTGTIGIDGNAFQNMSGLSILSVNTGNNVAFNSAMNVNISINPVP